MYLAAVGSAIVHRGVQSDNRVTVDIGPAASTEAGVIPSTLDWMLASYYESWNEVYTYASSTGDRPLLCSRTGGSRGSGEGSSSGNEESDEAGHCGGVLDELDGEARVNEGFARRSECENRVELVGETRRVGRPFYTLYSEGLGRQSPCAYSDPSVMKQKKKMGMERCLRNYVDALGKSCVDQIGGLEGHME